MARSRTGREQDVGSGSQGSDIVGVGEGGSGTGREHGNGVAGQGGNVAWWE